MHRSIILAAALLLGIPAQPAFAAPSALPRECRPLATSAPDHFHVRLGALCAHLVEAHQQPAGPSALEHAAAIRLAVYFTYVAERHLTGGVSETGRYLIARELGLFRVADALLAAPATEIATADPAAPEAR